MYGKSWLVPAIGRSSIQGSSSTSRTSIRRTHDTKHVLLLKVTKKYPVLITRIHLHQLSKHLLSEQLLRTQQQTNENPVNSTSKTHTQTQIQTQYRTSSSQEDSRIPITHDTNIASASSKHCMVGTHPQWNGTTKHATKQSPLGSHLVNLIHAYSFTKSVTSSSASTLMTSLYLQSFYRR